MENYYELFIPEVKNYGGVIMLDDEPVLFLLDDNNKMIDGIGIYNSFDEVNSPELYLMLDDDEMVIVSVDVIDNNSNIVDVKDITDENYNEFSYSILPLKMYTISDKKTSIVKIYDDELLEELLIEVVENYKTILKKSINNLLR